MRTSVSLIALFATPLFATPLYTVQRIAGGAPVSDISESGYVTGFNYPTAYLYKDGVLQDLGFAADGRNPIPRGVNVHGHVAGEASRVGPRDGLAFIWRNGQYEYLPTFGGFTGATDINDAGWVVGRADPLRNLAMPNFQRLRRSAIETPC